MHRTVLIALVLSGCSTEWGIQHYAPDVETPLEDTGTVVDAPQEPDAPQDPEDPPAEDDCDHTSDLVYVIDRQDEALYLFDPTDQSFDLVGELDCTMWGTPGSMAVSRDGFAYVRYSDDSVYAVDLVTLECRPTSFSAGFGSFGMGYATDAADTWRDALYIATSTNLATLDTGSWSASMVGGIPSQAELSGNADGELWAFLPLEVPAELVELDKSTSQILQKHRLNGFPNPLDIDTFAFATWGGEFWLFVRTYGMGNTTDVYRVDASGNLSMAAPDTGMDVVGAGVSTCAPTD